MVLVSRPWRGALCPDARAISDSYSPIPPKLTASVRAAQGIFSGGRQQNATWVGRVGYRTGSYKKEPRMEIIFSTLNPHDHKSLGIPKPRGDSSAYVFGCCKQTSCRGCDRLPETQVFFQFHKCAKMATAARAAAVQGALPADMEGFVVGLIGMGDMGKMYARRLSAAGWR